MKFAASQDSRHSTSCPGEDVHSGNSSSEACCHRRSRYMPDLLLCYMDQPSMVLERLQPLIIVQNTAGASASGHLVAGAATKRWIAKDILSQATFACLGMIPNRSIGFHRF